MASPLLAALMGGQGGGEQSAMYGLDPTVAAATPDIQLGQALIQGGLSSAPASPWQALARVAQTGTGAYLKQGALSDLAKAYAHTAENMAATLPEKDPVRAALLSDDPTVRMSAVQQYGKHILTIGEAQKLGYGQQAFVGGSQTAGNTNAQTEPARLADDIKRAQQTNPAAVQPLAQALTLKSTEGGYVPPPSGIPGGPTPGVPSGPPRVSPPPSPSAAIPPPQPGRGNAFAPGETILPQDTKVAQASPTFDQRAGGMLPGYAGAQATVAGAKKGAEETAANAANFGPLLQPPGPIQPGPGTTEPIKTAAGTTIPPFKDQGPIPTNPAQLKEALPAWQKKETEWNSALGPSQQAEQRLNTIASAFKEIETGKWTTEKANFAQTLKAVGIDPAKLNLTDPTAVQLALHENYVETLQQLKATTPRFTQAEFKGLSANKESPDQPPGANLQMLSEDIGTLRQSRDLPADFTAAKSHGWQNPQSFESAWLKANPLSGYVDKVKGEIGPLKGMPGFQGATKPGNYVWTPNGLTPK